MSDIVCEAFSELNKEVQQEFYDDVVTAIADVNDCVSALEESVDEGVIDRMFRAIHTVKGNCNMVFLVDFVNSVHRLEDLFSAIKAKTISYNSVYGRFAIQVVNLIQLQLKELIETSRADGETLENIKLLIDHVQDASDSERVNTTQKAIIAMKDGHFSIGLVVLNSDGGHAFSFMDATDIEFFEFISKIQQQNPVHQKFANICSTLAIKLNNLLSNSAEEQQIQAAIIFLQLTQTVQPEGVISELNTQQCIIASGLLSRMSGWGEAAELCIQAMENHDGSGAPKSLQGGDILPASQVVSLSFDFAYQIISHPTLDYKQALFTTVKVINAKKNSRYKDKLIQRFNNVIKTEYLTNQMF